MATPVQIIDPTAKMPAASGINKTMKFSMFDQSELEEMRKSETLEKSLINSVQDIRQGKGLSRLAFTEDPNEYPYYSSLWKHKRLLVPDELLKRIAITDDLVGAILNLRSNHLSAFGRELQDRFSTGFRIEPRRGVMQKASPEVKEKLQKRIEAASKKFASCGADAGWDDDEKMSLATFFQQQCRNSLLFGKFCTEIVWVKTLQGEKEFHSFRPVDSGTIYQSIPDEDANQKLRQRALKQLERLKHEKLRPEGFTNDEYKWVQVITNQPRQAFTSQELVVHNLYQVTDIELGGYPISPIDTMIAAVTTHINITNHNKLYFQNGRAAKGFIVIKSEDVTEDIVNQIRQHFQASINSVSNSWRVPIFGVEPTDEISWVPLDTGGRDMEFQYLSDSNARTIMAAFQISPEEVPGYQHLSRGTNSTALNESSNEFKLEAARDVGIRPLLAQFQDFLNDRIFPLIDKELSEICTLKMYGLDSDSAEKESTRIQQDMGLHLTMDEVLEKVEKDPLGEKWGGIFPLNPSWQQAVAPYLTVGEIREHFFGRDGAAKDPQFAYVRDQFWFTNQQMIQQQQQMAQQQQMQQQQAAMGVQPGAPPPGQDGGQGQDPNQPEQGQGGDSEIANGADQVMGALSKREDQLPPNRRRLAEQHNKIVENIMDQWERDSKTALHEILTAVKKSKK